MNRPLAELREQRDRHLASGSCRNALEIAIEIARRDPGRESWFHLGWIYNVLGRYRESIAAFRRALLFRTGNPRLLISIHLFTAHVWCQLRNARRMREALRRARTAPGRDEFECELHRLIAAYYMLRSAPKVAIGHHRRALQSARTPEAKTKALGDLAISCMRLGKLDEARDRLREALDIKRRLRLGPALALNRITLAGVYLDQGHLRRAIRGVERSWIDFRRWGRVEDEAMASQNLGYVLTEAGDWIRAASILDRAIELAESLGLSHRASCSRACRSTARLHLGQFEGAELDLRTARERTDQRDYLGRLWLARAEVRYAEFFGRWTEMKRAAKVGLVISRRMNDLVRIGEFQGYVATAERQVGRARASMHARRSADLMRAVVQKSIGMGRLRYRAERLAGTNLPILIVGEPGTGKSHLAQCIHGWSRRHSQGLVVVPCEQLTDVTRDLCGHVAGAWSGATRSVAGLITRRRRGTVILDGIDLLPRQKQRELLPILEGRVRPLGAAHEVPCDVRFIATCQDLSRLTRGVQDRLAGAVLRLPPLRFRRAEIPDFVDVFLQNRRRISCDAVAELSLRSWEGNLPELKAAIERLVLMTDRWIGRNDVRRVLNCGQRKRVVLLPKSRRMQ